jgi:hypothetical protein
LFPKCVKTYQRAFAIPKNVLNPGPSLKGKGFGRGGKSGIGEEWRYKGVEEGIRRKEKEKEGKGGVNGERQGFDKEGEGGLAALSKQKSCERANGGPTVSTN